MGHRVGACERDEVGRCALDDLLWTHGDPVLCAPLTSALEVSPDPVSGIQPGNTRG